MAKEATVVMAKAAEIFVQNLAVRDARRRLDTNFKSGPRRPGRPRPADSRFLRVEFPKVDYKPKEAGPKKGPAAPANQPSIASFFRSRSRRQVRIVAWVMSFHPVHVTLVHFVLASLNLMLSWEAQARRVSSSAAWGPTRTRTPFFDLRSSSGCPELHTARTHAPERASVSRRVRQRTLLVGI